MKAATINVFRGLMENMGNLNREMETIKRMNKILELKNTNPVMKNSLDRLNSWNIGNYRVSEYEDR